MPDSAFAVPWEREFEVILALETKIFVKNSAGRERCACSMAWPVSCDCFAFVV